MTLRELARAAQLQSIRSFLVLLAKRRLPQEEQRRLAQLFVADLEAKEAALAKLESNEREFDARGGPPEEECRPDGPQATSPGPARPYAGMPGTRALSNDKPRKPAPS